MIPLYEFTGISMDSVLLYSAVLGILLIIGTVLRRKVLAFKKLYLPASLIAGFLGLLLGPHFLGLFPSEMTKFWSLLAGRLIVLVFAPMMIGKAMPDPKKLGRQAGASIMWSYAATAMQYAVPILLSILIFIPLWDVHPLFASIVEQGWAGGHGTSGGMAAVFEDLNWMPGASLSVTSATVGLVFGVVMGTVLINIGVRRGWTSQISHKTEDEEPTQEFFTIEESASGSQQTTASNIIDSLAFHLSIVLIAVFVGWILNWLLKTYVGISVAWFVTALFGGIIVNFFISKTKFKDNIDPKNFDRISGVSIDFLVTGAVASINVPVVVEYAAPLLIQQAAMAAVMIWFVVYFSRKVFLESWFENGIVLFGTFAGVVATGMLLLRTCDPEMKSGAAEVLAARSPFTGPLIGGGLLTSLTPYFIMSYGITKVGLAYGLLFVAIMIALKVLGWWGEADRKASA